MFSFLMVHLIFVQALQLRGKLVLTEFNIRTITEPQYTQRIKVEISL